MSKNSRPRKAYRPKPIYKPMMAEKHSAAAVGLRMVIDGLIARPSADLFNESTRRVAAMADAISHMRGGKPLAQDRDPDANGVRTAVLTLDAIAKRFERTGALSVTDAEAASLRAACNQLDDAMKRLPANVFDAATMMVSRMK